MKQRITFSKALSIIVPILFILTPLISSFLFCLKDGKFISDIYIPLGGWSDEISYYKQIEGILSHGIPHGYFGYDQSKAIYGTFNVWGIFPLIPYVIYGFLFGWEYCSPIYANILFCTFPLACLYFVLHPSKKQMSILSIFWILNVSLNRHTLSGVIESSILMQLLFVIICGERILSQTKNSKRHVPLSKKQENITMIYCTGLICLLTMQRPYFAVFFLIPLWKAFINKQKSWLISLPITAILTVLLFFVNNKYFCSTYYLNILSSERLTVLNLQGLVQSFASNLLSIAKYVWYAIRYHGSNVGWAYLLLFIELLFLLCNCIYRWKKRMSCKPMFVISLVGNILILLSIILLYDVMVGARHILALIIANAFVIVMESYISMGIILAVACFVSCFRLHGTEPIPYRDDSYAAYMETLAETFSEVIIVTDEISYQNVVAMPVRDYNILDSSQNISTYYGLLYATPPGVGISLDFQDIYSDAKSIQAGYILVHPNGQISQVLEKAGMTCVYSNHELALYKNPNTR